MLPIEDFQFVSLSVAKDKQGRLKWIEIEALLHQDSESVNGLAHVRAAAGEVHPICLNLA